MDYKISLENEYIPEWNGNQKLERDEQIIIIWKWPTGYDKEACIDISVLKGESNIRINYVKLVERCIVKIKNFKLNGEVIKNGYDLLSRPGISGLADEVRSFLIPKLKDIDEKNL